MASGEGESNVSFHGRRVANIRPANIDCKLVVAVVRLYELPNPWISKDATSIEMVLQDREGDCIHCSIARGHVVMFKTVVRENGIYLMQNFVIARNSKPPRTTPHEYKLSFYGKTEVRTLASTTFEFSRFRFISFPDIEAMPGQSNQYQIDCIGYVVAKEDPKDMLTKNGQKTRCMSLYLEDLEGNKLKCTIFGDMVGRLVQLATRDDVQPLIVVGQLFKASEYLHEPYIQNTRYISEVFLNPDFPEVNDFKKRLLAQGESATQGIAHVESQPQYSVENELEGGGCTITSIEDVMNLTESTSCWILAKVMSVEATANSWCYLSCRNCFKKVTEVKNGYQCIKCQRIMSVPAARYRMHLIVADSTGCLNLMMWNDEAKLIIGKSAKEVMDSEKGKSVNSLSKAFDTILEKKFLFKLEVSIQNVNSIDYLYSVEKICQDEALIAIYTSQASVENQGMDHSLTDVLPKTASVEGESEEAGFATVSLSMDSQLEDHVVDVHGSPAKATDEDSVPLSGLGGLASPGIHSSSTRPPRRTAAKRKFD